MGLGGKLKGTVKKATGIAAILTGAATAAKLAGAQGKGTLLGGALAGLTGAAVGKILGKKKASQPGEPAKELSPEEAYAAIVGEDAKPISMPVTDSAVVEEARKAALEKRKKSTSRLSTILSDTSY